MTEEPLINMMKVSLFLFCVTLVFSRVAEAQLQVGASRVDITPSANALPSQFHSVHDPVYPRAIYLQNGKDPLLLINADIILIGSDFVNKVLPELQQATGVPAANILISATHDHSAPFASFDPTTTNPRGIAVSELVEKGMLEAATKAKANMQAAEVGYGTGDLYINVHRDVVDPQTRRWAQEPSFNYPSDKTLTVLEFRKPGGDPIAIYMNYAMHATAMFLRGDLSGDVPGAPERYVEGIYDDEAVAMWTSGAAGDQNPLYTRQNGPIGAAAIK